MRRQRTASRLPICALSHNWRDGKTLRLRQHRQSTERSEVGSFPLDNNVRNSFQASKRAPKSGQIPPPLQLPIVVSTSNVGLSPIQPIPTSLRESHQRSSTGFTPQWIDDLILMLHLPLRRYQPVTGLQARKGMFHEDPRWLANGLSRRDGGISTNDRATPAPCPCGLPSWAVVGTSDRHFPPCILRSAPRELSLCTRCRATLL